MWTLSIRPSRESDLAPVDVVVTAQPGATVRDLAAALGRHIAPERPGLLLAPVEHGEPWPATRKLAECGLRTGDVLDVTTVPRSWAGQPARPTRRRAVVRVLTGPDAGLAVAVHTESATLGRAADCTVTLTDPLVSRHHARLVLGATPVVIDEGSAHGVTLDGVPARRPTAVEWGTAIGLGDTILVLERAGDGTTAERPTGVLRPPRFGEPLRVDTLDVPGPPVRQPKQPVPLTMLAYPLLFGAGMIATAHSWYSMTYLFGMPLMMFGNAYEQRRRGAKEHRKAMAGWRVEFDRSLGELDQAAATQRAQSFVDNPEVAELPTRVLIRHPALWNRREGDPDYLAVRVGLGPVPALLTGKLAGQAASETAAAARELDARRTLHDMPVCLRLDQAGLVAVVGPGEDVDAAVRALALRLCCDHSPAELSLAAVLGPGRAQHESWLRWLPHVAKRTGGVAPVAVGATDGQALLERLAADEGGRGETVCLVDEEAGLPRRAVEAVAAVAAQRRLRLVWLGSGPERVPAGTDVLVDLEASVLALRGRGGLHPLSTVDSLSLGTAWRAARGMTGYTDEAAVLPADTALPEVVRLPELAPDLRDIEHRDADQPAVVLERWAGRRGLRAQIGLGMDGTVTLDLRDDGPHGLVAGTTGSGKSELLQTLICSLALNNPPERLTFLLVDYKGGAAFRECADLPHTVGYITDLTPALVARALTSLSAEVAAREELLGRYGVKDLVQLERDHPDAAPPSLLICVDEFAALAVEAPQFVDGMVNIAQRGRSLGLHLLLATQRPAGVVTASIRANTDLRIALRVSSTEDSADVLDAPDAARISRRTPGRAWIRRTGHGTAELVQAAWVGARQERDAQEAAVEVRPFTARDAGPDAEAPPARVHARTDLDRLVSAIGEAFLRSGRARPARPWLPPLPEELPVGCVAPGELLLGAGALDEERVPGAADPLRVSPPPGQVPIGLADQPGRQAQPPLSLNYPQVGHVLVYGASGSGKTEFLRTVAVSATLANAESGPYIYGIDYAGGGLAVLGDWPAVGSIVAEQQFERVLRLLRMLRTTVSDRNRTLVHYGVSDVDALAEVGPRLPPVHLLVDNLPGLLDALEGGPVARRHGELFHAILQEGRRVGVHVTATSPRRTGIASAALTAFGARLVLRMTAPDDYLMLGVPADVLDPDSPPGRALLGRTEVQLATVGGAGTAAQVQRLAALAGLVADTIWARPPVPAMPSRVPYHALPEAVGDALAIGVDAEYATSLTVPLTEAPLLVAGRARTGRTTLLAGLAAQARRSSVPPVQTVLIGPNARQMQDGDAFDVVLDDPAAVRGWLDGEPTDGDGWRLLLVDDAHLWERSWESDPAVRDAMGGLAALVDQAPVRRLAVVVAADADEARSRSHIPGVVQAARKARRGVLLVPDFADGSLFGVTIPSHTVEPLVGPGRGLWCSGATVRVVQAVGTPAADGEAA